MIHKQAKFVQAHMMDDRRNWNILEKGSEDPVKFSTGQEVLNYNTPLFRVILLADSLVVSAPCFLLHIPCFSQLFYVFSFYLKNFDKSSPFFFFFFLFTIPRSLFLISQQEPTLSFFVDGKTEYLLRQFSVQ